MNCHVCLESYNIGNRIPKNLSCGHTFCDRCLKRLGTGYEIECPKCRQKSKNNLSICYAIYDELLLENKADSDDTCSFHQYEKLFFYCNTCSQDICTICLRTSHTGHLLSSIKDKIISEENKIILSKWNEYFNFVNREFRDKIEKLTRIINELNLNKNILNEQLNINYDKYCEKLFDSKNEIEMQIDDLFKSESAKLNHIKEILTRSIKMYSEIVEKFEAKYKLLRNSDDEELNCFDSYIDELKKENLNIDETIEQIAKLNTQIKYKTINYSDEVFFNLTEVSFNIKMNEGKKENQHIIFIGDSKDKTILNYDLESQKMSIMENSFGTQYEFLDYSASCYFKSNFILITGGCIYTNYKNTATQRTYLAEIINKNQISFSGFKPMTSQRFAHGLCTLNKTAYAFGGHDGISAIDTTEYYDEELNIWIELTQSNMEIAREIFAYCVMDDRYIYVFGGFNETHLDTIERYDSLSNKWKLLNTKTKTTIQNATAISLSDKELVLVGGYNGTMQKNIDVFNINTEIWTSLAMMKVPRRRSHCYKFKDEVIYKYFILDFDFWW